VAVSYLNANARTNANAPNRNGSPMHLIRYESNHRLKKIRLQQQNPPPLEDQDEEDDEDEDEDDHGCSDDEDEEDYLNDDTNTNNTCSVY
jgi:hypothetical protein